MRTNFSKNIYIDFELVENSDLDTLYGVIDNEEFGNEKDEIINLVLKKRILQMETFWLSQT